MATKLRSVVSDILPTATDAVVVFLLDGSGSVGSTIFSGPLKSAVLKLGKLIPRSYKAVVQFASDTKNECMPTREYSVFEKAVQDMTFMNQGTDTAKGLSAAWDILITNQMKDLTKLVIVITDGCSATDTTESVKNLTALDAKIMCIGVGSGISYFKLKQMSSNKELAINLDDYSLLFKSLQSLETQGGKIMPKVSVDLEPKGENMCHDEPLELSVEVQNTSEDVIPAGAKVVFPISSYFYPKAVTIDENIEPYESWEGEITLKLQGGKTINEFPTNLEWVCKHGNTIYCKGTTSLGTGYLRGDFYYTKAPVNVLMFGRKGSGKSSFINTIQNSLIVDHKVVSQLAIAEDSPDHVTQEYTAYPMRCFLVNNKRKIEKGAEQIPFVFYDLWGDSEDDFKGITIQHFMKGCIPSGTKRVDDVVKLSGFMQPTKAREIHAVVFVVTLAARSFPKKIDRIKQAMKQVTDMQMSPLVVVTMCDHIDGDELEEAKTEMKQALKANRMYFVTNYSDQSARDPKNIDFPARAVLADIFANGVQTHRAREVKDKGYFRGVNWEDFTKVDRSTRPPSGGQRKQAPTRRKKQAPKKVAPVRTKRITVSVVVGDSTTTHVLPSNTTMADIIVQEMSITRAEASDYEIISTEHEVEFSNSQTLREVVSKMEQPYSLSIYQRE